MNKQKKNGTTSIVEANAQESLNMMVKVFRLKPSQYGTAKAAIDYAVKVVADPENHEDAVIATAFDFLSGYDYAKAEKQPINEV